jgi:hypothetical protein
MDEHKKPATERVTGTKTKPRLVSAKVPFPNEWTRSAHLPSVQGGLLRACGAECSRHASPFAATVPFIEVRASDAGRIFTLHVEMACKMHQAFAEHSRKAQTDPHPVPGWGPNRASMQRHATRCT